MSEMVFSNGGCGEKGATQNLANLLILWVGLHRVVVRCTKCVCFLICLAFAYNELARKVLLAYLCGFLLDPSIKSDLLDPAEIVNLHIMRIPGGLVGGGRQKETRKIRAVGA